jgi:alpha-L-arabinofuranosidase
MANSYDATDRKGPQIYVGEYAVNSGVGAGNLIGALAEAVFMLNMERNSDVVKMCSYAPLFENVNDRRWSVNLIRFDSSRVIGRSSYQVQKLFGANKPEFVLKTDVKSETVSITPTTQPAQVQQLYALGGLDQKRSDVVIKVVNPTSTAASASLAIKGLGSVGGKAKVFTLGHAGPAAENTLEQPEMVIPKESETNIAGAEFTYQFAPNSLTILRVPAR